MSLARRVERIEDRLEPEEGPWLRWPNDDGTITEVPGCRSLNDPKIAIAVARLDEAETKHDDDGIRQNPTF